MWYNFYFYDSNNANIQGFNNHFWGLCKGWTVLDLKPLCIRTANRLGIDPLDIKLEDLTDDSRLYIKENYVAINKKYENDYEECAKCIARI